MTTLNFRPEPFKFDSRNRDYETDHLIPNYKEEWNGHHTRFDALEIEAEVNRDSRDYGKWIQRSLNKILGLRLAEDGIMGPATRSGLRSFQTRQGLAVDGVAGSRTDQALVAAGAEPPPGWEPENMVLLDRFDFDRVDVKHHHDPVIKQIAERVFTSRRSGKPFRTIRIVGHTDPVGTATYNVNLGHRRAVAVRDRLNRELESKQRGLSRQITVLVQSHGENQPIGRNDTEEGRVRNRRVEVFLSTQAMNVSPPKPQRPHHERVYPTKDGVRPRSPCDKKELERLLRECEELYWSCIKKHGGEVVVRHLKEVVPQIPGLIACAKAEKDPVSFVKCMKSIGMAGKANIDTFFRVKSALGNCGVPRDVCRYKAKLHTRC